MASALGGASVNFTMLVIARTVQGAFGALLAPSVLALLTTTFSDPAERGKAFAIYGGIAGAGGAIGLLLGGILTSYASWRWTLFVNLAFAAIAATGALLWLKNDKAADHDPLDLPGPDPGHRRTVLPRLRASPTPRPRRGATPTPSASWSSAWCCWPPSPSSRPGPSTRCCRPASCSNRTRGGSMLAMLFASIGIFGVFLFLTYYLQGTLGFSPVKTGVAFLPMVAALATMAQVSNRVLLPKFGPKPIVPIGLLCAAGGHVRAPPGRPAQLLRQPRAALHHPAGLRLRAQPGPVLQHRAPSGLAPHDAGVGSATLNTTQQVGGSIGTALLNTLAAGAATAYLVGRAVTPPNLQAGGPAQLHHGLPVVRR